MNAQQTHSSFASAQRLAPAALTASAMTFGLFFLMNGLVTHDMPDLVEVIREPIDLNISTVEPPIPPRTKTTIDPPEYVAPPEPTPIPVPGPTDGPAVLPPVPPSTPAGPDLNPKLNLGMSDGHMIPVARVLPQYPKRAAERGVEGWVELSFTVTEYGTVTDAVVVRAEPERVFNRSALEAISKFKYKPTVVNGKAQPTKNVQLRLTYSLQE